VCRFATLEPVLLFFRCPLRDTSSQCFWSHRVTGECRLHIPINKLIQFFVRDKARALEGNLLHIFNVDSDKGNGELNPPCLRSNLTPCSASPLVSQPTENEEHFMQDLHVQPCMRHLSKQPHMRSLQTSAAHDKSAPSLCPCSAYHRGATTQYAHIGWWQETCLVVMRAGIFGKI
jgi:hypothetical protein